MLRRVARFLRQHFPNVPIRVVGDAGFAVPALYLFCEEQNIEYTVGMGANISLRPRGERLLEKAERRWLRHHTPLRLYSSFRHRGKRWRRHSRRICVKAARNSGGGRASFVITNRRGTAEGIFTFYHGRGECENRIEELKNGFAADRLSCHRFLANAFRLLLHAAAYNLAHYSRPADDVARLEVLKGWFVGQAAKTITAHQLETKLEAARRENHWAPATVNHHHTAVSLSFRLAIAKDKVKENPARKIRRVAEFNNRVRYLSGMKKKSCARLSGQNQSGQNTSRNSI